MSFKIRTDASGNGQFTVDSTDVLSINTNTTVSLPTGTANGVAYLNGSKVLTSGSALTFDGTNLRTGGITFADASIQSTGGYTGFRNRIINGDMRIDQRNNGVINLPASAGYVTVDRFRTGNTTTGVCTVQKSDLAPPGFSNSLLFTASTAAPTLSTNNACIFGQAIEGNSIYDMDFGKSTAKQFTLSFWVRSSVTGLFGGSFRNSIPDRGNTFSYTINQANTWEYKTVTVSGDTTGTWYTNSLAGLQVWFSLAASADRTQATQSWQGPVSGFVALAPTGQTNFMATSGATFYITGIQLEKGSVATPFEFRPYGTELALCQRYYYQKAFRVPCLPWAGTNNYSCGHMAEHPVTMRASPTVTALATATMSTTVGSLPSATNASQSAANITYEPGVDWVLITNNQSVSVIFGVTGSYQASSEL